MRKQLTISSGKSHAKTSKLSLHTILTAHQHNKLYCSYAKLRRHDTLMIGTQSLSQET